MFLNWLTLNLQKSTEKKSGSKEHHKHRSPDKHDLRNRIRKKHEKRERHLRTEIIPESHMEHIKTPPKVNEIIEFKQTTESIETEKIENVKDALLRIKAPLEEGEIDDDSNDICNDDEHDFKPNEPETNDSKVLPAVDESLDANEHNVEKVGDIEIGATELYVPKLDVVHTMLADEVQVTCTAPIEVNEINCLQHQEKQQPNEQHKEEEEEEQHQLSNGSTHNVSDKNENEIKHVNGIALETQCLDNDNDDGDDVIKVDPSISINAESIETVNTQNDLEGHVESNPMVDKSPEVDIEPQPNLEPKPQSIECIPQIIESNNLSESQNIMQPFDDDTIDMHNTSGGKSVNISTSSKDYLIFENENNEQVIYITRKKKKKQKKSKK